MIASILLVSFVLAQSPQASEVEIPAVGPLSVERDLRVKPGAYLRPPASDDGQRGVVVVEKQKGITLDLAGVELRGKPSGADLDRSTGWGIVLRDCEDVTIQGGKIGGYKGCIVAVGCKKLVLDGIAFDGWYGMRLRSTPTAEDPSDWLYPHENDRDEWITNYGAAISLTDCPGATIRNCRGRRGQNGILLTRSNGATIYDDDFSFLSGWGLAMYRTSKCVISRSVFDYCVRGYSHGVYWRGQDSAGILMFERCSDNLFAYNSATHGGDGIFLFAGQDTVAGRAFERGEEDAGGCDRNIWFRNDFSYAVANAIEATFSSDNRAIENKLDGSHQHGVWGGYSRRMLVYRNHLEDTHGGAVSIEHGQECVVANNWLRRNEIGIELWWDEDPDLVGGPFGKHRDTASRDHYLLGNEFEGNERDLVLTKTERVFFGENRWGKTKGSLEGSGIRLDLLLGSNGARASGTIRETDMDAWDRKGPDWLPGALAWKCPEVPGSQSVFAIDRGEEHGLETIVMGEWGPWDFRSNEPAPPARKAGGILAGCTWTAAWFSWKDGPDPRERLDTWRTLAREPLARADVAAWTDPWGGDAGVKEKVGTERFGLRASASLAIGQAGKHCLSVTSDDGVRLAVDGKTVLEDWTHHAPRRSQVEIDLTAGEHRFELEYFQIDGASALAVELERVER